MKRFAMVSLAATLLQGCAAIIDGSHQDIAVNTVPPQADCTFTREGGETAGRVGATPGTATIKKTKKDLTVRCHKDGYQEASYVNESSIDPWFWADWIIPGGIIGLGVDWGTGAWNEYKTDLVTLALLPVAPGAPSADPQPAGAIPATAEPETAPKPESKPKTEILGGLAPIPPAAVIVPNPETDTAPLQATPFGTLETPHPTVWPTTPAAELPAPGAPAPVPTPPAAAPAPAAPPAPPMAAAPATNGTPFGAPSAPLETPRKAAPPSKTHPIAAVQEPAVATAPAPSSGNGGWGDLGTEPAGWQH